jgi:3-dehydroquinate synthase
MGETVSYTVGSGTSTLIFSGEPPLLEDRPDRLHIFDHNTAALFPRVPPGSVVLSPGEGSKAWMSVETILRAAFELRLARDSVFVGVGGGMVCDIASFAASLYMRGTGLELVPTSLLAMVDAAFGGKTAINFDGRKNMVGTFYPAGKVHVSAALLRDLPEREFLSGLAEVIKSAMLGDPELFSLLETRGPGILAANARRDAPLMLDLARRSLLVKARFVAEDPTEKGVRAFLNLGHTFAHGLESATNFSRFTHGEAVAWGILRALDAGLSLGITDPAYAARARRVLTALPYPAEVSGVPAGEIILAMGQDKKKKEGRVRFVLQRGLADTLTMPLEDSLVEAVVRRGLR